MTSRRTSRSAVPNIRSIVVTPASRPPSNTATTEAQSYRVVAMSLSTAVTESPGAPVGTRVQACQSAVRVRAHRRRSVIRTPALPFERVVR